LYHLRHPSNAEFFIQVVPLGRPSSADEFAAYNWNLEQNDPDYYEGSLRLAQITVGSLPATVQLYGAQETDPPPIITGNRVTEHPDAGKVPLWAGQVMDVYVTDGLLGYVFTFIAPLTPCEFKTLQPEFSEILSSVRFISETIVPAEDGYTPATSVTLTESHCDD
jgi:hypothetical protein